MKLPRGLAFLPLSAITLSPLVTWYLGSTFLVDDWGQLVVQDEMYWETVSNWKELWGYRPLSLLLLPLLIQVLGDSWFLFAGVQLFLYLLTVILFFWVLAPSKNMLPRAIGLMLASAPAVASTVIFSPVNQMVATLSMIFAAMGHLALVKIAPSNRVRLHLILATIFFTMSLLTYEVALPLIAYSVLTNSLGLYSTNQSPSRGLGLIRWRYFVPAAIAGVGAIIWQKVIAPLVFQSSFSRLSGFSLDSMLTTVYTLLVSIPSNLVRIALEYPLALILTAAFLFAVFSMVRKNQSLLEATEANQRKIIFAGVCTLLLAVLMMSFSGQAADHTGYINRGMSLIWLPLALLLGPLFAGKKPATLAIASLLVASNSVWFSERVMESNTASDLRLEVVRELSRDSTLKGRNGLDGGTLVVDVPCALPGSESGVEIFCTSWDLRGALELEGIRFAKVQPLWDPGFSQNSMTRELQEDTSVVTLDDSGNIIRPGPHTSWPRGNPFNRVQGSREFLGQDCVNLFSSLIFGQNKSNAPELSACLYDPY